MVALAQPAPAIQPPSLRATEFAVLAGVLLFALGFAAAAVSAGGREAWDVVLRVPLRIVPILLGLSLLNYAMRGLRWIVFSRAIGLRVPPTASALYYVAGFAMTTTPGKLGEVVRLYLLHRFHGCAYDRTAALLVADRLSDGIATTLVVAATAGFFAAGFPAHGSAATLAAVLFAAALVTLYLRPALLGALVDAAYARLHRWPRLFVRARRAVRALQHLATPRVFTATLLMGALGWTSEGLSLYVLLHALGVAVGPAACVFVFAFAMLVGAVSFLPGGLGSTEATMIGLLSLAGVPLGIAIVATGVARITTLWFAVALGLIALPLALAGAARAPARA